MINIWPITNKEFEAYVFNEHYAAPVETSEPNINLPV